MPSARRVSWAKFRVAAVCVVALTILLTLFYLLTGGTLFEPKATVYMYVPDATGLVKGSPARVDGIGVGKVRSVDLSHSQDPKRAVRVTIRVEQARLGSIPVDSYAQLSTDTPVGDKFVDITSGKAGDHVAPSGEIPFKDQPELMKSLDLSQFQKQLRSMDATLTDIEQGKGLVGEFVMGDAVYNGLLQKLGQFQKEIRTTANANTALGRALYSDEMYRQVSQPVVQLEQSLERIQSGQGSAGQLFRGTEQYQQLRAGAGDVLRSLQGIRGNEFLRSDQQYVEWNRLVASLIQSVDELNANPLLTRSDSYESLNGFAKEISGTVRDFREHPGKYLRLKVF